MNKIFRRKKKEEKKLKKELSLKCENPKCLSEKPIIKRYLENTDVSWLCEKLDWSTMPSIVQRLNENHKIMFVTKMLTDKYDVFQCDNCDWFKLVKK